MEYICMNLVIHVCIYIYIYIYVHQSKNVSYHRFFKRARHLCRQSNLQILQRTSTHCNPIYHTAFDNKVIPVLYGTKYRLTLDVHRRMFIFMMSSHAYSNASRYKVLRDYMPRLHWVKHTFCFMALNKAEAINNKENGQVVHTMLIFKWSHS